MRGLRAVVFLAVLVLVSSGCKSKLTSANYDKVLEGMTLTEVEGILGEGKPLGDGALVANQVGVNVSGPAGRSGPEAYVWESDDGKKITIFFANGTAKKKIKRGF